MYGDRLTPPQQLWNSSVVQIPSRVLDNRHRPHLISVSSIRLPACDSTQTNTYLHVFSCNLSWSRPAIGVAKISNLRNKWKTNSVTYLETEMLEQVVHEDRWRYPRSHLQWGYYSHIKEGKPKKIIFWRKSVDATRSNFHWFCIFLICFHQILKTHQRWSTTNSCVLFKFFLHGVQREKSKPNVSGVKSCAETSSSLFY